MGGGRTALAKDDSGLSSLLIKGYSDKGLKWGHHKDRAVHEGPGQKGGRDVVEGSGEGKKIAST